MKNIQPMAGKRKAVVFALLIAAFSLMLPGYFFH